MKKLFWHVSDTDAPDYIVRPSRSKRGPICVVKATQSADHTGYISREMWDAVYAAFLADDAPDELYRLGLETLGYFTRSGKYLPWWMLSIRRKDLTLPAPEDPHAFVEWISAAWARHEAQFADGEL